MATKREKQLKFKIETDEQETHLNLNSDLKSWSVYTDQPKMIKLFKKNGWTIVNETDYSATFEIPFNQIQFVGNKKKRVMSEAERKKRSERMKKLHAEKKI